MLKLCLQANDYITINGDIVVQLTDVTGGRAHLRVQADRSIPIVRGKLLEQAGTLRPACLSMQPRKPVKRNQPVIYSWTDERERAAQAIKQIANRLEQVGQQDAAKLLRIHLNRLVPNLWEDELFCKDQPALWDTDAGQAR